MFFENPIHLFLFFLFVGLNKKPSLKVELIQVWGEGRWNPKGFSWIRQCHRSDHLGRQKYYQSVWRIDNIWEILQDGKRSSLNWDTIWTPLGSDWNVSKKGKIIDSDSRIWNTQHNKTIKYIQYVKYLRYKSGRPNFVNPTHLLILNPANASKASNCEKFPWILLNTQHSTLNTAQQ